MGTGRGVLTPHMVPRPKCGPKCGFGDPRPPRSVVSSSSWQREPAECGLVVRVKGCIQTARGGGGDTSMLSPGPTVCDSKQTNLVGTVSWAGGQGSCNKGIPQA